MKLKIFPDKYRPGDMLVQIIDLNYLDHFSFHRTVARVMIKINLDAAFDALKRNTTWTRLFLGDIDSTFG
jgi:hypothetical protein